MKKERLPQMLEYIMRHDSVSMETLSQVFAISMNTVRRDLEQLQRNGRVLKVYGGVIYNRQAEAPRMLPDCLEDSPEKRRIGEAAAACINDEDIVFVDSGTTTPWLVDFVGDKRFTLVTANLRVQVKASRHEQIRLIALPGTYMRGTGSFAGTETLEALSRYNITKAFMAANGFSLEHGATHVSPWEFETKKLAVEKSQTSLLLMDASKFDQVTLLTYCQPDAFDAVITNARPPNKFVDFFQRHASRLLLAE